MVVRIEMPLRRSALLLPLVTLAFACNDGSAPPANAPSSAGDGTRIGALAPALDVAGATGSGRLSIPKGRVVLVDFWATWCGPCEKSFPAYQGLYTKYKASGLEILAVSTDEEADKSKIPGWVKGHGDAKFLVGWDEGRRAAERWGIKKMPTAFLVDRQGVVRHVHAAFTDDEAAAIEKEIKALL